MAGRTLPGLGLTGFWALGEDGWKAANDTNLLVLSALVQPRVISIVSATPGAPANGDIHYFDGAHPTQANKLAIYDNGGWVYLAAFEGMTLYNLGDDTEYIYDGAALAVRLKRVNPAVQTVASAATVTPTFANDQVNITAQAVALDLANPTGTAIPAHGIVIRIKDAGAAKAITYGAQYRGIGVTLPATTVLGKTLYLGMIYNSTDTKWDVVAVAQEA